MTTHPPASQPDLRHLDLRHIEPGAQDWVRANLPLTSAWVECPNPLWLLWSIAYHGMRSITACDTLLQVAKYLAAQSINDWTRQNPDLSQPPRAYRLTFDTMSKYCAADTVSPDDFREALSLLREYAFTLYPDFDYNPDSEPAPEPGFVVRDVLKGVPPDCHTQIGCPHAATLWLCLHAAYYHSASPPSSMGMYSCLSEAIKYHLKIHDRNYLCDFIRSVSTRCYFLRNPDTTP